MHNTAIFILWIHIMDIYRLVYFINYGSNNFKILEFFNFIFLCSNKIKNIFYEFWTTVWKYLQIINLILFWIIII